MLSLTPRQCPKFIYRTVLASLVWKLKLPPAPGHRRSRCKQSVLINYPNNQSRQRLRYPVDGAMAFLPSSRAKMALTSSSRPCRILLNFLLCLFKYNLISWYLPKKPHIFLSYDCTPSCLPGLLWIFSAIIWEKSFQWDCGKQMSFHSIILTKAHLF